ncbi:MAG: hypothetical protein WD278_12045, partial [Pirellulales bacterium]
MIAIVLLATWAAIHGLGRASGDWHTLATACWRVGLVMAVLWLALPQTRRLQPWLVGTLLAGAILVAIRPKLIPLALGVLILFAVLRPRQRWGRGIGKGG